MQKHFPEPNWEHAGSRFMRVTHGVIDALQTNFFNGISLGNVVPGLNNDTAAVIVAESLEADRVVKIIQIHIVSLHLCKMKPREWRNLSAKAVE